MSDLKLFLHSRRAATPEQAWKDAVSDFDSGVRHHLIELLQANLPKFAWSDIDRILERVPRPKGHPRKLSPIDAKRLREGNKAVSAYFAREKRNRTKGSAAYQRIEEAERRALKAGNQLVAAMLGIGMAQVERESGYSKRKTK